jgi:hypothetical protein
MGWFEACSSKKEGSAVPSKKRSNSQPGYTIQALHRQDSCKEEPLIALTTENQELRRK